MKELTVRLLQAASAGMLLLFCIHALLGDAGGGRVWEKASAVADHYASQDIQSEHGSRMNALMQRKAPKVRAGAASFTPGQAKVLWDWLEVQTQEHPGWGKASAKKDISAEILDIFDGSGISIRDQAFQKEEENAQELTIPLSCSPKTGEILFHQSGSYAVMVKITDSYGRTTVTKVALLVDAG